MKRFLAPLIGAAVAIGGIAWWMMRPYPTWQVRTDSPEVFEASIVGRDGANEAGALWLRCERGVAGVQFNPGQISVAGGTPLDAATLGVASYFYDVKPRSMTAPMEIWSKPAGEPFLDAPDSTAFVARLGKAEWLEMSPGGRTMTFHVDRLRGVADQIASRCPPGGAIPPGP